ncbi:MAG: hypothetical protein IEMM0003_0558 [bacterium]|nr:MAG: hypothetical protein IEMM0003_0558 [bacterium]
MLTGSAPGANITEKYFAKFPRTRIVDMASRLRRKGKR